MKVIRKKQELTVFTRTRSDFGNGAEDNGYFILMPTSQEVKWPKGFSFAFSCHA